MRVIGFCTTGFHVRYVETTTNALARASAMNRIVEGECDSCRKEREEKEKGKWQGTDARRAER